MDTISLLWRHEQQPAPRRGRPPRFSTDEVVAAGVAVADDVGADFSLREVAGRLGTPVMSLYSYVESREQLLELMIDHCRAGLPGAPLSGTWRERLATVAAENLDLCSRHPWLAHWESERAILGPGTLAKYERELHAVEPLPVDDVTKDAILTMLLDFVRASARASEHARAEREAEDPRQWWEREGERLAALHLGARYPLAGRVGNAAGEAHGAAVDAQAAYRFGLRLILDGVAAVAAGAGPAGAEQPTAPKPRGE